MEDLAMRNSKIILFIILKNCKKYFRIENFLSKIQASDFSFEKNEDRHRNVSKHRDLL